MEEFDLPMELLTYEDILGEWALPGLSAGSLSTEHSFPTESSASVYHHQSSSSSSSSPDSVLYPVAGTGIDLEDHATDLAWRMACSTLLDESFNAADSQLGGKHQGWLLSSSPQSTLSDFGICTEGSSRGSPTGSSRVSSPPATTDLLHAAAGQVASFVDLSRRFQPSISAGASPEKFYGYPFPTRSVKQNHGDVYSANQRRRDMINEQIRYAKMNRYLSDCSSGHCGPLGLSESAWPPLPHQNQNQNLPTSSSSSTSPSFAKKRTSAGTGVFLPRQIPPDQKTGKSPFVIPTRVVHALKFAAPQAHESASNVFPSAVDNVEILLPAEWTY